MARIVSVLLPLPLPEAFDYEEPEGLGLSVGEQVAVPLGARLAPGVVTAVREGAGGNRPLKPVSGRLEALPLSPATVDFIQWAARYAAELPGLPLAIALRGARAPLPRPERLAVLSGHPPSRLTPARTRVLEAAREGPSTPADLARRAGVSAAVVRGLIDDGALEMRLAPRPDSFGAPDLDLPAPPLNDSQAAAAAGLRAMLEEGGFQAALLDGVTGSGKTEVYLEAIRAALGADPDGQVLILLPEIALTQALISRVTDRFGAPPGEWHSGVAPPARRQVWDAVAEGRCRIVVGARSALFLPFRRLRLIVVDEEHDTSFKQEEGFIYQARDLAVVRAKLEGAAVILASATPSLETLRNAETGRYRWLRLADRHGEARLPDIRLVDLRESPPETGRWISPPLAEAMAETLAAGEQTLLFLNRRGFSTSLQCPQCGHVAGCPNCSVSLTYHRASRRLLCHICGHEDPVPDHCPAPGCGNPAIRFAGIGTERVEDALRKGFPQARVERMDSDTLKRKEDYRRILTDFRTGKIDILVGTQMIAKGLHFPNVTLVGIVHADLSLHQADFRAGERTFQLLTQVSGRAGRGDVEGEVFVQSFTPFHPAIQYARRHDFLGFYEQEVEFREQLRYPPAARVALLTVKGRNEDKVKLFAEHLRRALDAALNGWKDLIVAGPAPAPLLKAESFFRHQILLRTPSMSRLSAELAKIEQSFAMPGDLNLIIDIDPVNLG